jgi:hypothetical protein
MFPVLQKEKDFRGLSKDTILPEARKLMVNRTDYELLDQSVRQRHREES